jgi:heme/copper-type cytochrome/quinol oxidase subunit 4
MDKKKSGKTLLPLLIVFLMVNCFCLLFKSSLYAKQIDPIVLAFANCILFVLSLILFLLHKRSVRNKNPNVFVRSVMAGTFIKLLIIAGSVLVYLLLAGENKSFYAILAAMGLYIIYTALEVKTAFNLNKENGRS